MHCRITVDVWVPDDEGVQEAHQFVRTALQKQRTYFDPAVDFRISLSEEVLKPVRTENPYDR
jgi:hypothetical protein